MKVVKKINPDDTFNAWNEAKLINFLKKEKEKKNNRKIDVNMPIY